jgi:hypothetical protein
MEKRTMSKKKERTKLIGPPSLQERIAAALADADITSGDLASLITEVEAAANAAENVAKEAHARALDPTVADPAAAREAQREAEFTTQRLDAALPLLDARLDEVRKAEDRKRWHVDCDALEVERDALAAELREVYPAFEAKISNLFARIAANDKQLSNLHVACAAGVRRHLLSAELVARGLENFSISNPSLTQELKLPNWEQSTKLAWPQQTPPLGVLVAEGVARRWHPGADWGRPEYARQRAAEVAAEQDCVQRYYADQARQREDRENAEARERIAKQ